MCKVKKEQIKKPKTKHINIISVSTNYCIFKKNIYALCGFALSYNHNKQIKILLHYKLHILWRSYLFESEC